MLVTLAVRATGDHRGNGRGLQQCSITVETRDEFQHVDDLEVTTMRDAIMH